MGRGFRYLRLVLCLLLGLALRAEKAPERVVLQLKWQHQFQFAGYYAAREQGYYREAGLDVAIVEADPILDPVREVVEGRAHFGVSNSGLLLARLQGQPVVVLAAIFQHSPLVLIARTDVGIGSVHDLVGRRLMLERHAEELLAYLQQEGVPLPSLQPMGHSFDPTDLLQGRTDALSAYSSDEPFFLDRAGFRYQTFTPRSAGIDFYGDNLFTTEAEIRRHPDRVRAFREASMRGWRYAMTHPEAVADLILARYGRSHSREHLLFEARQMAPLLRPELVEMGYMHEGRWQHIADTYADLGLLPRPYSLQGFLYDPDAADRLTRQRLKLALILILPIAALLGTVALVILGLNRRLARALRTQAELGTIIQGNERRFRFIAEHAADVIWTMDIPSGRFTYVSPSVFQLRGYTPEEIMSRPASEALTPESAALVRADLLKAMAEWNAGRSVAPRAMEVDQPHKDGRLIPTEVVTTLHADAEGHLVSVLGISRDITLRRQAEERLRLELQALEEAATTDLLTHAWNRRHFEEAIEGEIHRSERYGHPLSLLILDIDHFKRVNDTFGHAEGDRVLRQVADCVRGVIRVSDSLTRWGGEEFIVLMPSTGLANAQVLAERIREGIAAHAFEGIGTVTVSLGLAEYLPPSRLAAWLERADQALYRAKHAGRNRVETDPLRRDGEVVAEHPESSFLKLVWSPAYRCGNVLIDTQHERLFRLANELLDALLSGRPIDEIAAFVSELLADVVQHFHDEEAILAARAYPGLADHARKHAELVARALQLEQAFRGGTLSIGSLFQFLAHDVVAQHMLKADREFFPLVGAP
ncbi:MAG: diguanylate cyclase [Geothrix sp.]|uniref:diguanylate cyclase n=1 Tax=Geothrix sp. TaxID=1962974 RepID=UPI00182B35AC|nr:diguanylate cyclase [Geothrix sp.]NWJ40984.1 diguanylate cyclase [Geothrix sp.]WIL21019.1 MAG: diguanylate cyclase [Geothrix sp.]